MIDRRRVIAGLAATGAVAAAAPTRADLAGDIAILRAALALHPGLYRYSSPGEMAARIEALTPAFVAAPDLQSRYLTLSRFLATIPTATSSTSAERCRQSCSTGRPASPSGSPG